MSDTRGVFRLRDLYNLKIEDKWVDLDDVWIGDPAVRFSDGAEPSPNTGYFGGGVPTTSLMDKVTYASDTTAAVPGANLTVARNALAASSARANGLPTTVLAPAPVIV